MTKPSILSEQQKEAAISLFGKDYVDSFLEEEQVVVSLYGDYEDYKETSLSEQYLQIQSINKLIEDEISPTLESLTTDVLRMMEQSKEFGDKINSLENVIEPDKADVHNIDRRIELLAQRVAEIESSTKKGKRGFGEGKKWRFDKE